MTAPVTHEVSGCAECPWHESEIFSICLHPVIPERENGRRVTDTNWANPAPAWCPLREAPVLVTLRKP